MEERRRGETGFLVNAIVNASADGTSIRKSSCPYELSTSTNVHERL